MGTITGTRPDGSVFSRRVTARTSRLMIREPLVTARLEGIADATGLEVFEIGTHDTGVDLGSLDELSGLATLQEVSLYSSRPVDLAPLRSCPALRSLGLSISGTGTIDLSPLAGHESLESVRIRAGDRPALDLGPLATLPRLAGLAISGGAWRALDLGPLRGKALERVTIDSGYLTEIALHDIASPALRGLWLMHQRFERLSLEALRNCDALQSVQLGGNEMIWLDVTGVARHQDLTRFGWPNVKDIIMDDGVEVRAPALAHLRR